jgi:hypothetical protein
MAGRDVLGQAFNLELIKATLKGKRTNGEVIMEVRDENLTRVVSHERSDVVQQLFGWDTLGFII